MQFQYQYGDRTTRYEPLCFTAPSSSPLSQIDGPVDNIEEEEGEGEEGPCVEVDAFGRSRYDRLWWPWFLVGFVLGL